MMKLGFNVWVKVLLAVLIEEIAVTLFRKSKKSRGDDRASESSAREGEQPEDLTGSSGRQLNDLQRSTLHIMADGTGYLTRWQKVSGSRWGWVDVPLTRRDVQELKREFGVLFD